MSANPEGVNLLGTAERVAAKREADRKRYAVGPFGQAWVWTISIILTLTSLYKVIAGTVLAFTLPTTKGIVLGWIFIPGNPGISYVPRIEYEVDGTTYHFVAGTVVGTLTDAPTTVPVSYAPLAPGTATWNTGEWWSSFFELYLMVVLFLGLILFVLAIYQWRIRSYWDSTGRELGPATRRSLIWVGAIVAVGGYAWLVAGYADPATWVIPPDPNVIAAFLAAIGTALLVRGLRHQRRTGA